MSADHMIDWFLVEGYFAETVTPTERIQIEHWIAADTDRQEIVQRIQAALHARSHHQRRDWCRNEAIETVLTRVQGGGSEAVITALPQRPCSEGRKLTETLRHWFEGATELAAAMLLDANEQPLSDEETKALRDQINDSKREQP